MLNSISYLEIRCTYNYNDLFNYTGANVNREPRRIFMYRNRRYVIECDPDKKEFYISNWYGIIFALVSESTFQFYVNNAPEIGLNLIWGLLAQLNIYPVTSL